MGVGDRSDFLLSICGGFSVEASDGIVGIVETPLFPPDQTGPDFLALRLDESLHRRRPILPVALVEHVDLQTRVVRVHGGSAEIAHLPEHLPIAT